MLSYWLSSFERFWGCNGNEVCSCYGVWGIFDKEDLHGTSYQKGVLMGAYHTCWKDLAGSLNSHNKDPLVGLRCDWQKDPLIIPSRFLAEIRIQGILMKNSRFQSNLLKMANYSVISFPKMLLIVLHHLAWVIHVPGPNQNTVKWIPVHNTKIIFVIWKKIKNSFDWRSKITTWQQKNIFVKNCVDKIISYNFLFSQFPVIYLMDIKNHIMMLEVFLWTFQNLDWNYLK